MKPVWPNVEAQVIPDEIQTFIEQYNEDDFFSQYVHLPNEETPAYVQASLDSRDDTSTYLGSERHAPPLTLGLSPSPASHSRASPPSPGRLEDCEPQGVTSSSWPGGEFDQADTADYLRHVGAGPQILIQGPMTPSSKCIEDDMSINLSPGSPAPSVAPLSPVARAMPMKRGRSNPLPGDKRIKVSNMRRIKACTRCHIRKRECDDGVSCKHCVRAHPKHPEVCVREKLSDARFPEGDQTTDIWTRESTPVSSLPQNWQLCGTPYQVVVRKNQSNDSPKLVLALQPYYVNARPSTSATGYSQSPAHVRFGSAPLPALGSWPGVPLASAVAVGTCLAPGQQNLPQYLLIWAESQLLSELHDRKAPDFEAAILSFLLAYKDSPLILYEASSSPSKNKLLHTGPRDLVRRVCEMRCWYLIWQTSKLYTHAHETASGAGGYPSGHSQLPPTVILELKKIATGALIACERDILLQLDELPPAVARVMELPLWACIWQLILIYRQLASGYSKFARNQLMSSVSSWGAGFNEVSALPVVEHLYRLLVIKYDAHFGSASPVFPKRGQRPTAELLEGDERLRREWEDILLRRKEFYQTITGGVEPDAYLKILVVDVEATLENRARKRLK